MYDEYDEYDEYEDDNYDVIFSFSFLIISYLEWVTFVFELIQQ